MRRKLNVGAMTESEEKKLLAKLELAGKCPYHQWCSPELIGPKRMLMPEFAEEESWEDWHLESKLYAMFPDALLFPRTDWTCFCRECAKKNPTPGKHNKFGYGFTSQYSWRAAVRGWESACARACKRMIINSLKGEIEFGESSSHSTSASQIHH